MDKVTLQHGASVMARSVCQTALGGEKKMHPVWCFSCIKGFPFCCCLHNTHLSLFPSNLLTAGVVAAILINNCLLINKHPSIHLPHRILT